MLRTCCGCAASDKSPPPKSPEATTKPPPNNLSTAVTSPIVANQPCAVTTVNDKRNSVVSHVRIELTEDDDDVFQEGVGPPIKLADNLAVREPAEPLPKWLVPDENSGPRSDNDTIIPTVDADSIKLITEDDIGPLAEIATCLGREQVALSRQRFFAELMQVARCNACVGEHNRDDSDVGEVSVCCHYHAHYPSNNNTAAAATSADGQHQFQTLLSRLEKVTARLESVCLSAAASPSAGSADCIAELLPPSSAAAAPNGVVDDNVVDDCSLRSVQQQQQPICDVVGETRAEVTMSVQAYMGIVSGPLAQYMGLSQQIGGDVAEHSRQVKSVFDAQHAFLNKAASYAKPASPTDLQTLLGDTSSAVAAVQSFCEKHRSSPSANHLWAVSESIPALGWVAISPAPAPYIKEFNDAGQFYGNRVLKEWKGKDQRHVDWVKAWVTTLTELQMFVKSQHTTGLVWAGKQAATAGGAGAPPPPPPGGCPPPPPPTFFDDMGGGDADSDRSALFAQINKGQDITKSLKKVTSDMQTHKNSGLRTGPAPFKAPSNQPAPAAAPKYGSAAGADKSPVFVREGKKWIIEYQKNNPSLLVEGVEMNNVVYLFKCENSTVTVKGKLNSITLDSCKKTSVVFESLVSCVEFINCQSIQMQVLGKVPTISIDKTDGCQVYLSPDSLTTEIVSSKSSEVNVLVPKGNGDYAEYPVPEQLKTTVIPGKGLKTTIIESIG